ncbi:MAG: 23S rRNA (adenine(2030)-N(6))-methyltransferase RlmJ [Alteromonadaceae bacterium]|nr:23S rRNA (adenine(2030)-N(6))-methyltransferase RlmJ [Alteromonadaceae bacterium]
MLSYRHAFHAGNFADVLKHSVLTLVLEYMTRKDKGFTYIDSHSGAGMYQLADEYAQKTGEYKDGIAKIINADDLPEALAFYHQLILSLNPDEVSEKNAFENELSLYPGSPGIAKEILRRQDSAHLFELHSTDNVLLTEFCQRWRKAFVKQSDGYQGVLSLLPPPSRRGVVLIDPPYELKEDYQKAVKTIIKAYEKFATGTYILWYPVVKRSLVDEMKNTFINSQVKNLLQVELCLQADTDEYGMTGTGLFIVKPPWQLKGQLENILPYLQKKLGNAETHYCIDQLIEE